MDELIKLRATDLVAVLRDYITADEPDEDAAWAAWNSAWARTDEMTHRDALVIVATRLAEAERQRLSV